MTLATTVSPSTKTALDNLMAAPVTSAFAEASTSAVPTSILSTPRPASAVPPASAIPATSAALNGSEPMNGTEVQTEKLVFQQADNQVTAEVVMKKLNVSYVIGEDDVTEGKITLGKGKSIVISGLFMGELRCEGCVIVKKGAKFSGTLVAGQAWIDGEVASTDNNKPSSIDVGTLHFGKTALVNANVIYDFISMDGPARGMRGSIQPRESVTNN